LGTLVDAGCTKLEGEAASAGSVGVASPGDNSLQAFACRLINTRKINPDRIGR
jgi:hypothetical protein